MQVPNYRDLCEVIENPGPRQRQMFLRFFERVEVQGIGARPAKWVWRFNYLNEMRVHPIPKDFDEDDVLEGVVSVTRLGS